MATRKKRRKKKKTSKKRATKKTVSRKAVNARYKCKLVRKKKAGRKKKGSSTTRVVGLLPPKGGFTKRGSVPKRRGRKAKPKTLTAKSVTSATGYAEFLKKFCGKHPQHALCK